MKKIKLVINECYGGFGLSKEAMNLVNKCRKAKNLPEVKGEYDLQRDDEDLVAVVEELGDKSFGSCSALKIVEIPADVEWMIDNYDGVEKVLDRNRVWF